jgi:hypothetical protein
MEGQKWRMNLYFHYKISKVFDKVFLDQLSNPSFKLFLNLKPLNYWAIHSKSHWNWWETSWKSSWICFIEQLP